MSEATAAHERRKGVAEIAREAHLDRASSGRFDPGAGHPQLQPYSQQPVFVRHVSRLKPR
jgi:hypothetical protein